MHQAEIAVLPDEQKKDLCLELLTEFGADHVRIRGEELQHNCTLGLGGHSDNNSYSASVNYHSLEFNCFVCGYGGPLSWWIAVNRRTDSEAVEPWLKRKLGIGSSLPLETLNQVIDSILHPKIEKPILPKYPEKILDRWTSWGMFHPYLTEPIEKGGRELPIETLEKYRIGYADEDEEFGYYQRIIVPVFWKGQLVGWQARKLWPDDPHPEKYRNSIGFPRDYVLYGAERGRTAVCVESPMSVLRHDHQIPHVATLGSNVTSWQLRALERFDRLIIANENDKAGWKMTRLLQKHLARKVELYSWDNPFTKDVDPADIDDDTYMDLIDKAVPIGIWEPKMYREQRNYIRPRKD